MAEPVNYAGEPQYTAIGRSLVEAFHGPVVAGDADCRVFGLVLILRVEGVECYVEL